MIKAIYTTILLILFVSVSTYANNKSFKGNSVESIETNSKEISVIKVDDIKSDKNTVSLLLKYCPVLK